MKKIMKVLLTLMIVFTLVASSLSSAYAERWKFEDVQKSNIVKQQMKQNVKAPGYIANKLFKDMDNDFWAYKAIEELVKRGIINGYLDNTFKPNARVSRSEFATMLTKALKLEPATTTSQTFADVKATSWDYKAVEASKNYLTGYKTSDGTMYFYGSKDAVREDMAVALVKALNLTLQDENGQLKDIYKDYASISENLKDYVYTAYKEGIMIGSNGKFAPQGNLTRAEAATLLNRALEKVEKVVVDGNDDQKVIVGDTDQTVKSSDATLSNLTVDGTTVSGFSSGMLNYVVVLPAGTTRIPSVAAAVYNSGATQVVTQAQGLPGTASVAVTAQDTTTKKTYNIYFTIGN
jgi:hypothetical protein